jgi:pimeloyl-ACP methyl ester carboxylesterase
MQEAALEHHGFVFPSLDYGGAGKHLVFLHGNGYPPSCYRPLLGALAARYHALAMLLRPLWPRSSPEKFRSWNLFSDDLVGFLAQQELPSAIAIGHSLGATVALRAALLSPAQFGALVLIEPVLLPPRVMLRWLLARTFGLGYLANPLMRAAAKRRTSFDDLEQLFAGYRRRKVFRYFSDENLRIFIQGMTRPAPRGGYELAYSPEWETRVYYTAIWNDWDLWKGISRLDIPTLIVRGSESDTLRESTTRAVSAKNPGIQIKVLDEATHLVPLEKPEEVFECIDGFLRAVIRSSS